MRAFDSSRLLALLFALTLIAACGGQAGPAAASSSNAVSSVSTLTFDASWNETASVPLVAGRQLRIDYDAARLPDCRASHNGNPGWNITAFLRFLPSGSTIERELFEHPLGSNGAVDSYGWIKTLPVVDIPAQATSVEVWFRNRSAFDSPCERWDSNYGANYVFAIVEAPTSTLSFLADWQIAESGQRTRGGQLTLHYDLERLRRIARTANGTADFFADKYGCFGHRCCSQVWTDSAYLRWQDGGVFAEQPASASSTLTIPADATRLELYFKTSVSTTSRDCIDPNAPAISHAPDVFYDSNYGRNFVFELR